MSSSMSDGSSSSRQWKSSPVPYRVGPLDYQPVVMCQCRCPAKAARWISWSTDNPRCRYYKCQHARAWCDGPTSSFIRELLNDLRDMVNSLRRWKELLQKEVEDSRAKGERQRREIDYVRAMVAMKKEEIRSLKARNQKLEKEKKILVICMMSSFCHAISNGDDKYEVKHYTHRFTVNLDKKECSCRYWHLSGLPCPHAIACIYFKTNSLDAYIAECYSVDAF
uniref:SWIM-type domain-containing protein n=1 Tax=Oryza glumipatula TaxID=40148 RepID=A0A0D9ZAK1_9ORYZ